MTVFSTCSPRASIIRRLATGLLIAAVTTLPAFGAEPPAADSARVIVKFKAGSALDRMRAPDSGGTPASQRAQALGVQVGLALRAGASLSERSQVVHSVGIASADLAARLAKQPDVEYAVVDRRRRSLAVPNDTLYLSGGANGPAVGQWYLRPPTASTPSAINAETAWDMSLGSSNMVVAVIDTGIRFDHAELVPVGLGGNVLSGYDFIADVGIANDGNGRDADSTDPGDWITVAENSQPGGPFQNCGAGNSSWHGTEVAALIGAATDNGFGMAGVGRRTRLLPVRVLGKCGGYDSDIIAGMRWAAGLSVPGVPTNQNPARVINLSLGGAGTCSALYSSTIAEINAAGAIVVAAAGNSAGHAVSEPGNCSGVIAVAALRHVGTKVGFSDLGPEIALSAPGGNCVDVSQGSACRYPILTARNAGTTLPIAGSSVFSDSYQITVGTSFAAPLVSGTAALMLAVRPAATPAQIRNWLQQSARPFPTTGGDNGDGSVVAQCTAPQTGVDQLQCYCTTSTCGAGMLDVTAAVRGALLGRVVPSSRDFNNDGNTDILFQNNAGQIYAWYLNGAGLISSGGYIYGGSLAPWRIAGSADLNGDGNVDLLFQNASNGQLYVWYLNGAGGISSGGYFHAGNLGDFKVVGIADLNIDGKADILFQNAAGQLYVWYLNGAGLISSSGFYGSAGLGPWKVVGTDDLNNDGNADILFQNSTGQGELYVWYMNGAGVISSGGYFYAGSLGDFKVVSTGDLNGDGKADILFQNNAGQLYVWYMNGAGVINSGGYFAGGGALGDWRAFAK